MKKGMLTARFILMNAIRLVLLLTFIGGFYYDRKLVLAMSFFGFLVTFIPSFLSRFFKINIPGVFEIMVILFVYGLLFIGDVRGLFDEFWWWDIALNGFAAVVLGFVGLTIANVLQKENVVNGSPFVIALFSFCFAVSIGVLWEIFEFSLDYFFGFSLHRRGLGAVGGMMLNSFGALAVSIFGYIHSKRGNNFVSSTISNFVRRNSLLFQSSDGFEENHIRNLISKGESHHLEFKSTLRTNLYTKQPDKKVEHAVLKTVAAYLNSNGGTLLVGVGDKGEILGLEHDSFTDDDQLRLYFTNLIKSNIGGEYMPYIKFDLVDVEGKKVLKVDCKRSSNHVFLKNNDLEEFYIRNGPSSMRLDGNALVNYIQNNFWRID